MGAVNRLRRVAKLIAIGLVLAAVVQEAARPRAERTWRGRVLGVVPYDFNPPTWDRVRSVYWNPDEPRLFTDRVLGVGWGINLHRARVLLSRLFSVLAGEEARPIPLRRRESSSAPRDRG